LTSVPTHLDHHSGKPGKVVTFRSEQVVNISPESVVNFDWNQWSRCPGYVVHSITGVMRSPRLCEAGRASAKRHGASWDSDSA